jgi:O-antigen ligase
VQSARTRNYSLSQPQKARLLNAFWFLTLLLTPLSLPPAVFGGSAEALEQTPALRAMLLGAALVLGLISVVFVANSTLGSLVRPGAGSQWVGALGLLVAWLLLSTPFGNLAPVVSGIGSAQRMDGPVIQAGWFLLALIAYLLVREVSPRATTVLAWALAAALATSLWAFLQGVGLDPLTVLTGVYLDIPAGAFGHGALAGGFLAFVALLAAWQWLGADRLAPAWMVALFVLGVGVSAVGGRAAFFGLLAGYLVSLVEVRADVRKVQRLLLFGAAFAAGFVVPLLTVPRAKDQVVNLGNAVTGTDLALNARFSAWKGGLRLLVANPAFGVGPGGFDYGVWPLLDAAEAEPMVRDALGTDIDLSEGSYVISGNVIATSDASGQLLVASLGWDKAHNYLLDLGLTAGIPAVLFYLGFLVTAMVFLWRSGSSFGRGVAIGLVSFSVFGLGWFGTISLDPVVWVLVGAGLGFAQLARSGRGAGEAKLP